MFEAIVEFVFGLLGELLVSLFWWLALFPVVWLVSLTFIMVIALFRRQPYWYGVSIMLIAVHGFWRDCGLYLTP